jgi:hypothetical protein
MSLDKNSERAELIQQQLLNIIKEFNTNTTSLSTSSDLPLEIRVSRLIVLLKSIESQLVDLESTLLKILSIRDLSIDLQTRTSASLSTLYSIKSKVTKARLNLNFAML